jgi:hypothetical protein
VEPCGPVICLYGDYTAFTFDILGDIEKIKQLPVALPARQYLTKFDNLQRSKGVFLHLANSCVFR